MDSNSSMKIEFSSPAASWEEALPIGNGKMGAMVYGTISTERKGRGTSYKRRKSFGALGMGKRSY